MPATRAGYPRRHAPMLLLVLLLEMLEMLEMLLVLLLGPRSVFRVLLSRKTRASVPHDLWEQLPPGVLEVGFGVAESIVFLSESNGFDRSKAKTKYWIEISYWPSEKHKHQWDVPETGSSGVLIYGCEPQIPEDTWEDVDAPGFEDMEEDVDENDGEEDGEHGDFSDFENEDSILRNTPENIGKEHGS
eukprot:gene12575-14859_t